MANSIFIKADELAKELDISQGLAYKMIAQWNEELKAKGYTTVGRRIVRIGDLRKRKKRPHLVENQISKSLKELFK